MTLREEFQSLQQSLSNIPGKVNVFFEAHYWGKFRLLPNSAALFPDPTGWIPLAQSQFPPFDHWLLIDEEKQNILLRQGDEHQSRTIAYSLEEFLGASDTWAKILLPAGNSFYFDQRKKLNELLEDDAYLLTNIRDPEYFEVAEAYVELLHLCTDLSQGDLHFKKIEVRENEQGKVISLQNKNKSWQFTLTKELFDNVFIDQLNGILQDLGLVDYVFSTSVSEDLRMLVLRLSPKQFQLLDRMGLLI